MNKIALILLNYNSWQLSIKFLDSISKIDMFQDVYKIIVDNKSNNDSVIKIAEYIDRKKDYVLLENETNAGYAAGNNLGLRHALKLGFDYAIVVNNDIIFNDSSLIYNALNVFKEIPEVACVSPRVFLPNQKEANKNLKVKKIWYETFGAFQYRSLTNKYKEEVTNSGVKYCYNYRPQGCCMLVDLKKLEEIDFLDENTFLYMEEPILAERLLKKKYRSVCLLDNSIIHNHKSTTKTFLSLRKYKNIYLKSAKYYYKRYLKMNPLTILICQIFNIIKIYTGVL